MAYFSNGTEGELFIERQCAACLNFRDPDNSGSRGCAILDAHLMWNYDRDFKAKDGGAVGRLLDHFIPRDGMFQGDCKMRLTPADVERDEASRTGDLFAPEETPS